MFDVIIGRHMELPNTEERKKKKEEKRGGGGKERKRKGNGFTGVEQRGY